MPSPFTPSGPPLPGQEQTLDSCLDVRRSWALAHQIAARPHQCFANAWRALIERPDLFADAWFIEGWFVIEMEGQVTVNEHGWIACPDGSIVDPSVILIVPAHTPVFYFAGVARSWQETVALDGQTLPRVCFDGQYGSDGLGHPGYRAAREAACRKVYALALAHTPCLPMRFWRAIDPDAPSLCVLASHSSETGPQMAQVRQPGEPVLDLAFSETVARTINARIGCCWYNVRAAMLQMPHPFIFARMVEGWLIEEREDRICLVEHGWLHLRDWLLDPTIVRKSMGRVRLSYVPGLSFSWGEVQQWADYPLPLARFLVQDPDYRQASEQARARAEQRAWQTGLPLVICPGWLLLSEEGEEESVLHQWEFPVPATLSPAVPALLRAWRKEQGHL